MAKKHVEFDPVKQVEDKKAQAVVWSTAALNAAIDAIKKGLPLKANPFLNNDTQLLKPDLVYRRTEEEIEDWIHCKEDKVFFANKCFLKTPEGVQKVTMRDYQENYLYMCNEHPFSIFRSCRQSGKCLSYNVNVQLVYGDVTEDIQIGDLYNRYTGRQVISDSKVIEEHFPDEFIYVKTPKGKARVLRIYKTKQFNVWYVSLKNGKILSCADTHILYDDSFNEVYAKDVKPGMMLMTEDGPCKVNAVTQTDVKEHMYDIEIDDERHMYYSNGFVSHNSTTTAIDALHELLFNTDKNGLIVSKSGQAGIDLLTKMKDIYRYLPWHLKAGVTIWNVHKIAFDNNSSIYTESASPTCGLGATINYLILDEFAWMPLSGPDLDLMVINLLPVVTADPLAKVRIMSTQNGHNLFYKLFMGAMKGENEYYPFTVNWPDVPEWDPKNKKWVKRDENWKRKMIRKLGSEEDFEYQYGTNFLTSDFCLASRECLTKLHNREVLFKNLSEDDKERIILPEKLKNAIFLRPGYDIEYLRTHWFVVLKDLAEGCKGDYTVFHIFEMILNDNNTLTFDEVGYWRANDIELEEAALSAWVICQQLFTQDRFIVSVELNTYGILFEKYLMDLNEPENHPEWSWRFQAGQELDFAVLVQYKKGKEDEDLPGVRQSSNAKTIPGIRWNSSNKPTNCQLLKGMIEKDIVRLYDISAIAELEAFEDKSGKGHYKASYGHDDIIMTCVQIPKLLDTARIKSIMEEMRVFKPTNQQEDQGTIFDMDGGMIEGGSVDIMRRLRNF